MKKIFHPKKSFAQWALLLTLQVVSMAYASGQAVPRKVLVEHFTNTRCSVCASRNPGFYTNLRQQSNTLHIAYHPSSPYSSCLFSTQNPAENDARTNYYGVYGGTPQLVINGTPVSTSQNYAASSLFTPYQNQTSPLEVLVSVQPKGLDSITATTRIITRASHSHTSLTLYTALVEDTVFYTGSNGESRHYDVHRKSFSGNNALSFVPSSVIGNAVTITQTVAIRSIWNTPRLSAIGVVQSSNGQVIQSAASNKLGNVVSGVVLLEEAEELSVYPNPVKDIVNIKLKKRETLKKFLLVNASGEIVKEGESLTVDVTGLPDGFYLLQIHTQAGETYLQKVIKQTGH